MKLQVPPKYLEKYLDLIMSYPFIIRAGRSLGKTVTIQHLMETGYFPPPLKPLRRKPLSWMVASAFEME